MSDIRERVRKHYARTAGKLNSSGPEGCCPPCAETGSAKRVVSASAPCCPPPARGAVCCGGPTPACDTASPFGAANYGASRLGDVPEKAAQASLGCGDPTVFAGLCQGDHVLDLGSGAGLDALLAARAVGPTGFVHGVDMTDEMLALAERNRRSSGLTNVAFVRGFLEELPFDDDSFDVIISNCVINLAADKALVLGECRRVLRPGGRLAISDTVLTGSPAAAAEAEQDLWSCCIAGAMEPGEYRAKLAAAGFTGVSVDVSPGFAVGGYQVANARITATKPAGAQAAGPPGSRPQTDA